MNIFKNLTILPGTDKNLRPEGFPPLTLSSGEMAAIVGNTGSGKSRLIKDIEQLVDGDSVTGRKVLLNGNTVPISSRLAVSDCLVAHLAQNMRFVLDISVEEFIRLHCECRKQAHLRPEDIIEEANMITPEPIYGKDSLNLLSGGQSRALMIADIAIVCDSPVVLIDEIENAGIDKIRALNLLTSQNKLVLMVTHDPHSALMASRRIVMKNGAVTAVVTRTPEEKELFQRLDNIYLEQISLQNLLRKGEYLI